MQNKQSDKPQSKKQLKGYARYSGMAFQMLGTILGGTFLGIQLDKLTEIAFPFFTIIAVIISVVLAVYFVIKDLI